MTTNGVAMAGGFQVAIDCAEPARLVRFWAGALHYVPEPAPDGFATWDDYWRDIGVPDDELDGGPDSIVDPTGRGPRIVFLVVPEAKTLKNRLHFDLHAGGGRSVPLETRKQRVDAEAARLETQGATVLRTLSPEGLDHYAVAMADPEGNEFDIN